MAQDWNGKIAFASGKTGDYDIWTFDLGSGRLTQITSGSFWNDKPHWSPDGQWIVFVSNRTEYNEIFKVHASGGEPIQLTNGQKWNDSPCFSPDGRQITFISTESGNTDIWIMDADGQNRRPITKHEGSDDHVQWTPDGKGLLWSSDRDECDADVWHFDLDSGTTTQLTSEFGADITPTASPDGRLIAFVSNRQHETDDSKPFNDRDKDIWLMASDGSWPVRITENQGADYCPCWSPDGRYLMYASSDDRTPCHLRVIDVFDVSAAYSANDQAGVEQAARAIRDEALPIDRDPLKGEIGAQRYTNFVTAMLPEKWVTSCYPHAYFGLERYPHWAVASAVESTGHSSGQGTPAEVL